MLPTWLGIPGLRHAWIVALVALLGQSSVADQQCRLLRTAIFDRPMAPARAADRGSLSSRALSTAIQYARAPRSPADFWRGLPMPRRQPTARRERRRPSAVLVSLRYNILGRDMARANWMEA